MLIKESGGGKNVFGHDPTIFVGAGTVTKAKYLEYKKRRVASGNKRGSCEDATTVAASDCKNLSRGRCFAAR